MRLVRPSGEVLEWSGNSLNIVQIRWIARPPKELPIELSVAVILDDGRVVGLAAVETLDEAGFTSVQEGPHPDLAVDCAAGRWALRDRGMSSRTHLEQHGEGAPWRISFVSDCGSGEAWGVDTTSDASGTLLRQ